MPLFISAGTKTQTAAVQLIGLLPVLAVSVTLVKGFTIGLVVSCALVFTMLPVSLLRHVMAGRMRLPLLLMISTTIVTVIHLAMQSFFFELSTSFSIYMPLIAVNCLLHARLEEVALRRGISVVFLDSITVGLNVLIIVTIVGAARELSGYGGFDVLTLAPGAFIGLGLLVAMFKGLRDS